MATTNPTLTATWQKVVDAGDEFSFGLQGDSPRSLIAVAAVATDTAPSVAGHYLSTPTEQINRGLVGPGYVYARLVSGSSVTAWLHSWTP